MGTSQHWLKPVFGKYMIYRVGLGLHQYDNAIKIEPQHIHSTKFTIFWLLLRYVGEDTYTNKVLNMNILVPCEKMIVIICFMFNIQIDY